MHKKRLPHITCIGAANVDRKAWLIHEVRLQSSNPVTSVTSCGGVARNIAEYLGRLGCQSYLLTYIGNDKEGEEIVRAAEPFIDFHYAYVHPTQNTGSYTAILDQSGDMVIGIADMGIYDTISPVFIKERWSHIVSSQLVVLDTNLSEEVLAHIIEKCSEEKIPLCVVPGSGEKVKKLPNQLQGVSWLILNREEAQILSNISISRLQDIREATRKLTDRGAEKVVVTCGREGVYYYTSSDEEGCITPPHIDVVDVTGAGDAFSAGVLYAHNRSMALEIACKHGVSCSILALQTHEAVNRHLNEEVLAKTYRQYFG